MRNNAKDPTPGHIVMMGAAAAGWLVLFLVALNQPKEGATWWILVAFSGVMLIASTAFSLLLWLRLSRKSAGSD